MNRTEIKSALKEFAPSQCGVELPKGMTWSKYINTAKMAELRAMHSHAVSATKIPSTTKGHDMSETETKLAGATATEIITDELPNAKASEAEASVFPVPTPSNEAEKQLAQTLDTLLNTVTKGSIKSLQDIVKRVDTLRNEKNNLSSTLVSMEAKIRALSTAKPAIATGAIKSTSSDGSIPNGTLVMAKAQDIFLPPSGKKVPVLDFDVPTFEWDAPHPLVPDVDPNYIFNPAHLVDFLFALVTGKNTWIHGHTGTGKTTLVEQVCARLSYPMMRINMDNDIERADFLGSSQLTQEGGVTVSKFVEGVLPRAMQMPCVLLIDECDFGKSGIMYVLQRALESKGLLLTEDGGRLVVPNSMFRMVASANTRGQGDEMGCYPGARVLSNAFLDRFTTWIHVDYMGQKEEQRLLETTFPSMKTEVAEKLAVFAREIRKAFINRELLTTISPRSLISIGEASSFYAMVMPETEALKKAITSAFIERATDDTRAKVHEIANRIF